MFESELDFARELADGAAVMTLSYFQHDMEVRQKADKTPVTEADLRVEAMIREEIARHFPGDTPDRNASFRRSLSAKR